MSEAAANTPGVEYVWPCWWGGVTRSSVAPTIAAKLREARLHIGGFAAKKAQGGPSFPVRNAKELAQKLAQALSDLDMVASVVSQEVTLLPTDTIPDNKTSSGKPVFRTLVHVKATVRIGAPDGSFIEVVGSGNGGDVDDKAGGKASTYAWKDAVTKGLTVPEQDLMDTDDEAPSEGSAPETLKRQPSKSEAKAVTVTADESTLAATTVRIAAATTIADLEKIKDDIKSGKIALAGADKLRASTAFVAKRKQLDEATATPKE